MTGTDGQRSTESIFLEFVEQGVPGSASSFESLLERHPDHAEELKRIHAAWQSVRGLLEQAPRPDRESTPYTIESEHASGAMGIIYRVCDERLQRTLAMKVIRATDEEGEANPLRLVRFLDEAKITAQLAHPGVVPVHELGASEDGQAFFTMPLVEGHTFEGVIQFIGEGSNGWTQAEALRALLRVCDTMAFAHARGVLHRDLKPSNLMVGRYGEVYVMDWGLARLIHRGETRDLRLRPGREAAEAGALVTMDGDVIGTPAYMPPEQAKGQIQLVDERSDVYSMGAILYHLLVGKAPYCDASEPDPLTLLNLVREEGPPPVDLVATGSPAELVAICEKAMSRERDGRYPSMAALASDLRAFLDGRAVQAHAVGAVVEFKKWVGRNRALAISITAGLTVTFAALVFALYTQLESRYAQTMSTDPARILALRSAAEDIVPSPENIPRLEQLRRECLDFVSRFDDHSRALAELRNAGAGSAELDRAEAFREQRDRFVEPGSGVLAGLERDLAFARRVERDSFVAEPWKQATDHYAANYPSANRFPLKPQLGLLPLGSDPRSGLLEFGHLQSGDPAHRELGELHRDSATGLILVLIPAWLDEAPFFLSKYEMTQAQWERVTGTNPSFRTGADHPVENVSWLDATRWLAKLGLTLPSNAQWLRAARTDDSDWWQPPEVTSHLDRNDHRPTGLLAPNPFGLHDVLGNVAEWCLDAHDGRSDRRVYRGGCFRMSAEQSWLYMQDGISNISDITGIRPARPLQP